MPGAALATECIREGSQAMEIHLSTSQNKRERDGGEAHTEGEQSLRSHLP